MDPEISLPQKKIKLDLNFSKCIFCQAGPSGSSNLQNLTIKGFASVQYAVLNRDDTTARRLKELVLNPEEFLGKNPKFHPECRKSYTNKKTVQQKKDLSEKQAELQSDTTALKLTRKVIDYKNMCFICEKTRDRKGSFDLVLIATKNRENTLHEHAKYLNDHAMLNKIEGHGETCKDLIAADFRYHKLCWREYLNRKPADTKEEKTDLYKEAFLDFASGLENLLFAENKVFRLTSLTSEYCSKLEERGIATSSRLHSNRFALKLQEHFGKRIQVITRKGPHGSLVCASDITVSELISELKELNEDFQSISAESYGIKEETEPSNRMSYHSAKQIREDLIACKKDLLRDGSTTESSEVSTENPDISQSIEFSYDYASKLIPQSLYNHLAWLITDMPTETDESGRVKLSEENHEKVLNLAQDIAYNVTKMDTPKHVGISLHILKETRSKKTINMLNRYGSSSSYDTAHRYMTNLAQSVTDQEKIDGFFTPSNLTEGQFVHCAIDNLDFHEYTRDGTTLHATTVIFYQYDNAESSSTPMPSIRKGRARSLQPQLKKSTPSSNLSLKDRQSARSLTGLTRIHYSERNTEDQSNDVWNLLRMKGSQLIPEYQDFEAPSWSSYMELLQDSESPKTKIAYGSLIPNSPTDPSVVEEALLYCQNVVHKMGGKYTVVTCDQAIYEIAHALRKKNPQLFQNLILRMGGFHIAQNFLGCIGLFCKDSGLDDLLVDGKAFLRGTMNKIMSGKDYYLMNRAFMMFDSFLFQVHWKAFEDWLINEGTDLECISELVLNLENLKLSISKADQKAIQDNHEKVNECLARVRPQLQEFDKSHSTPTSKFWFMYEDMIEILRTYIAAERSGNWSQHISAVEQMLPYIVASGHYKYANYLPIYLDEMKSLQTSAPDIFEEFLVGNFTVHRNKGMFNGVWSDLALEQTYNREGKSALFKGITQNETAMQKYIKISPFLTQISEQIKEMGHTKKDKSGDHHDNSTKQVKRDNTTIDSMVGSTNYINPWNNSEGSYLLNIATGQKADSKEIIEARQRGMEALRMAQQGKCSSVERVKLAPFFSKNKKFSKEDKTKQIHSDESHILRSMYFMQNADEKRKLEAFQYEWMDYPPSLFERDNDMPSGFAMRKGQKSDFLIPLQAEVDVAWNQESLPANTLKTLYIIDMMAFVQRNQTLHATTFKDLAQMYLSKMLKEIPENCNLIHVVGDRYDVDDKSSLKGEERHRWEKSQTKSKEYIPVDDLQIPDWKQFCSNRKNKGHLLNYLSNCWTSNHCNLPQGIEMVLGGMNQDPGKTVKLTKQGVVINSLSCENHEEADTRLIAHINYAVSEGGCKRAIVQATDTDVILLCIYYASRLNLEELWVEKNLQFIPAHEISKQLSVKFDISENILTGFLLNIYVLTGCDTVSYPFRKGKKGQPNLLWSLVMNF